MVSWRHVDNLDGSMTCQYKNELSLSQHAAPARYLLLLDKRGDTFSDPTRYHTSSYREWVTTHSRKKFRESAGQEQLFPTSWDEQVTNQISRYTDHMQEKCIFFKKINKNIFITFIGEFDSWAFLYVGVEPRGWNRYGGTAQPVTYQVTQIVCRKSAFFFQKVGKLFSLLLWENFIPEHFYIHGCGHVARNRCVGTPALRDQSLVMLHRSYATNVHFFRKYLGILFATFVGEFHSWTFLYWPKCVTWRAVELI